MLRFGAWDLYCHTEHELRIAAIAAGLRALPRTDDDVPFLCKLILLHVDRLLLLINAAGWLEELADLDEKIRRMLNPPAPRQAMGACPHCAHGVVWAEEGAPMGRCSACGSLVQRHEVADRLLARLNKATGWMTASEYRDHLAREGIRIPTSTIRGWSHRGLIHARNDGRMPVKRLVELTRERSRPRNRRN